MGELEIARVDLPKESRVNVIGKIEEEYKKYLPYIRKGLGVKIFLLFSDYTKY